MKKVVEYRSRMMGEADPAPKPVDSLTTEPLDLNPKLTFPDGG